MSDEIDVQQLDEILKKDPDTVLIDVREPDEHADINIGGRLIPMGQVPARLAEIPKDVPVYLYCRSGNRSRRVLNYLKTQGYGNCVNVAGGILAWLQDIDPAGRPGA